MIPLAGPNFMNEYSTTLMNIVQWGKTHRPISESFLFCFTNYEAGMKVIID